MVVIPDPSQGISISQQAAQGFITLPWTPYPFTISTGFSTALAATPDRNPFINIASPFDTTALKNQRFVYTSSNGGSGDFSSTLTTNSSVTTSHISVSLGVSIGNSYLNAGVTGSYDKDVLSNQASSKSSRKCSFVASNIRSYKPPALSTVAVSLLKTSGFSALTNTYGDYYIDSFIIGAEAAAFVYTSSLDIMTSENIEIVAHAHALCFNKAKTLEDKQFLDEHSDISFGITAFDTLEDDFVSIGKESDSTTPSSSSSGLSIEQVQALGVEYAARIQNLPARVEEPLAKLQAFLGAQTQPMIFNRDALQAVVASGLILQIVLVPFARLREVQEILSTLEPSE